MKVILLGCGYLGYNLYSLLKKDFDTQIWGIDSPYASYVKDFTEIDAFDPEALSKQDFRDAVIIDAIGLIANNAVSKDEALALETMQEKYAVMLRTLKEGGAHCFVYFSSGGTVYGSSLRPINETHMLHPMTLYARSKAAVEETIQESGINYLILRLSNPYGGYQVSGKKQGVIPILLRKAYQEEPFSMWIDGGSVRDYFYISDLAKAISLLIQKDIQEEIVNIGSGHGTSLDEVIAMVEKVSGKKLTIHHESADVPVVESIVLDISKLKQLTGYEPSVSMEEGIRLEDERIRKELGL
ncbi:MAG: NAD-dependent epimerase/dehydratase family protein [Bulleidia sp.]|nr:NAD-dependent epimerase/dehydratase family protein [Bulleidia sp.]